MLAFLHYLRTSVGATPRAVWVLIGGQFVNRLGSFVYPFLALYLQQAGYSALEISAVLASLAAGTFLAPPVGGFLADAIGRRSTIVLALTGGALSMIGIYASDGAVALCAAAAGHGFLTHLFGPAASALITDLVPPERRQVSFSLFRFAINAGFALGPALGGLLFGLGPALIFFGDAVTTLVFAFLASRYLPHGLRTVAGNAADPRLFVRSWIEAGRDVLKNGPFVRFYVCMLLMTVTFMQIFTVLSLHAAAVGLTPFEYGIAIGFNGLIVMCCELPMTHVTERRSPTRVLVLGFAITALGCASFGLANSLPMFIAAMAVFTAGEMLTLPVASAYASILAPEKYRGRYFGILGTTWGIGALAASAGPVFHASLGAAWWPLAAVFAMTAAMIMSKKIRTGDRGDRAT